MEHKSLIKGGKRMISNYACVREHALRIAVGTIILNFMITGAAHAVDDGAWGGRREGGWV